MDKVPRITNNGRFFFGVASALGKEIPIHYLIKLQPKSGLLLHIPIDANIDSRYPPISSSAVPVGESRFSSSPSFSGWL